MQPIKERASEELTSWKEIAEFLDVSVRTAQRYQTDLNLPVRRLAGRGVTADREELLAWKRRHTTPSKWWTQPGFLKPYSLVATVLALLLGAYASWDLVGHFRSSKPARPYWTGRWLVVTDHRGNELWKKEFEAPMRDGVPAELSSTDLNGDGRMETIVLYVTNEPGKPGYIYCFSEDGRELWKISVARKIKDRQTEYSPTFVPRHFNIFPSPENDGTNWIASLFVHSHAYPSVLMITDSGGKSRGEYWHSGHLQHSLAKDLDGDGEREIVAVGVSHSNESATLVVFDPRNVGGSGAMPPGHPRQLSGFGPGTEKAVATFGRTRLNLHSQQFNFAERIGEEGEKGDLMQVQVNEYLTPSMGYLVYTLRSDLSLLSIDPSVSLTNTYKLESVRDLKVTPFGSADIEDLKKQYAVQWK